MALIAIPVFPPESRSAEARNMIALESARLQRFPEVTQFGSRRLTHLN